MEKNKKFAAVRFGRLAAPVAATLLAIPGMAYGNTCAVSNHAAAENFIRDLHRQVSETAAQDRNSVSKLNNFIRAKVPVEIVSKGALGIHWRQASNDQRTEYRKLFEKTVFPGLADQILRYRGATYTIVDNRSLQSNDRLVSANVKAKKGAVMKVGWRLKFDNCNPIATDMFVDGVSLMVMKRQEFASVISNHGIDGLLARMRVKADRMKQGASTESKMSPAEMGEIVQDLLRGAAAKVR